MDYLEYDRIQADLGAIGCSYMSSCEKIILNSKADEENKKLAKDICDTTEKHFDDVALLISKVARLMTK